MKDQSPCRILPPLSILSTRSSNRGSVYTILRDFGSLDRNAGR